jgi:Fe-S-cluster containining protein
VTETETETETETTCARCGDCCDPVVVPFHVETWAPRRLVDPDLSAESRENCEFMLAHWTTTATLVRTDDEDVTVGYEVRCDAFDPVRRLCGAHADRPPVCRDFPWYGRAPGDPGRGEVAASLSPRCSFNADVPGRRLLPLTVVTR